ncbi:MAG TPA: 2TM domain-containing protein [Noviherbaspirillum sp.]|nr:2TM domain-containing protein [Noviherbaspirillum sp.]
MEHTPAYRTARRHVERKIGFTIHLAVFLTVNTGLILFNLLVVPNRIWVVWPLFGWGIGLLFHGLAVFLHAPGAAWKERMIQNELKKRA